MYKTDHIAYRVHDKEEARKFFETCLAYKLTDTFDIKFDDGTACECYAMVSSDGLSPEIFLSQGEPDSIVYNWVQEHGNQIHHIAYEVESVEATMKAWLCHGVEFLSEPLHCPDDDLIQVFTKVHPFTGMIYELIQRGDKGFCRDNVKQLMESTDE